MSDLVIAVGTVVTALAGGLKVILDYRTTTRRSAEVMSEMVVQIGELKEKQDILNDTVETNSKGNRNIIRYRVRKEMTKALERGFEYSDHYTEVVELYHTYKELGGNGVIDSIFEKYDELPLKQKEN